MEQTPAGQVFDNWRGLQGMYPEWTNGASPQKPIWEEIEYPQIINRIDAGYVTEIEEVIIDGKQ